MAADLFSDFRENKTFIADVRSLLEIAPNDLMPLRKLVGSSIEQLDSEIAEKVESLLKVDRLRATHTGYTMQYMVGRLATGEATPEALVDELQAISGKALEPSHRAALIKALASTPEEIELAKASAAFSFGDTYLVSSITPIFSFGVGESSGRLFPGCSWTINYRESSGTARSLSLHLSALEMRDLGRRLIEAADDAERKLASVQGAAR